MVNIKVGDRIVVIKGFSRDYLYFTRGDRGIVMEVVNNHLRVMMDSFSDDNGKLIKVGWWINNDHKYIDIVKEVEFNEI